MGRRAREREPAAARRGERRRGRRGAPPQRGLRGAARSSSWVAPRAPTPHSCVKNGGAPEESDEDEEDEEDAAKSDESSPAKSDGDPAPAAIMTAAAARELLMQRAAAAGSTDSPSPQAGAGGGAVPPVQPMPRRSPVVGSKADGSASKSTGKSSVRSGPAEEAEVEVMGVDSPADNGGKASGSTRSAGKKTSSSARGAAKSGGSSAKKSNGKSPMASSEEWQRGGRACRGQQARGRRPPLSCVRMTARSLLPHRHARSVGVVQAPAIGPDAKGAMGPSGGLFRRMFVRDGWG